MIDKINETYYKQIANSVNNIIPVKWERIALYAEMGESSVMTFFYFYDCDKKSYIQGGDLYDNYSISRTDYRSFVVSLSKQIRALHDDILQNTGDDWTQMTFLLQKVGKFNVEFGYEDLNETTEMERRKVWKDKYLHE